MDNSSPIRKKYAHGIRYTRTTHKLSPKTRIKSIPDYWKTEVVWVRKGKISKAIKTFNLEQYSDWEIIPNQQAYGNRLY